MDNFTRTYGTDKASEHSDAVTTAVMNITKKLHETQNFHLAMSSAAAEIGKLCDTNICAIYAVDKNTRHCTFINAEGIRKDLLEELSDDMDRTPYEIAEAWERDLEGGDCLLLDSIDAVKDLDPAWHRSLANHELKNIILYALRFNHNITGFIWAANFDGAKILQVKEILELTSFIIAAVISNHQLISRLEIMSTVDAFSQINNRSAMDSHVEEITSGNIPLPGSLGVVFADLNELQIINETEGLDAGNRLISKAAAFLKIIFDEYELYRAGGDEFIIFCPDITEEMLNKKLAALRELTDKTPNVSLAIGSEWCSGNYDICEVMDSANEKMYKDKEEYYHRHPEKSRRKKDRDQ